MQTYIDSGLMLFLPEQHDKKKYKSQLGMPFLRASSKKKNKS